jgi:hypothetical protein
MHWVVCNTQVKKSVREISESLERKVSNKLAHFPRELGRKSQGGIFCFECCFLFVGTGRTIRIRTGHTTTNFGMKIEEREGMVFEARFVEFSEGGQSYRRQGKTSYFRYIF